MKKNIGSTDKIIRLALAAIVAVLYFTKTIEGTTAIALGIVAIVLTLTSLINFCPLYTVIGKSTCKEK
jgi:Protein of unknown function (DUF2892)